MVKKRNRTKQEKSFEERLTEQAQSCQEAANLLPEGEVRDLLVRRARQIETALRVNAALRAPDHLSAK